MAAVILPDNCPSFRRPELTRLRGRSTSLRWVTPDEVIVASLPVTGPPALIRTRVARRQTPEVYRHRRIVAFALAAFVAVGLWLAGNAALARVSAGPMRLAAARVYTVRPGDTLWSIAASVQHTGDIRPLVQELSAETGGRPLQPGEQVTVP